MKSVARIALLLVALSPLGCATGGLTPVSNPMPAARAGLAGPYRVFYDALVDYGEWTLIEPYGYVFRPNVSFIGWQPYEYGFWVPNDTFGWVWISSEPFGWATYHYGSWMFDRYEGWVWLPGLDWGPAWTDWQTYGDYVGWSPTLAQGSAAPSTDTWRYLPATQLAATDLKGRVLTREELLARAPAQQFKPLENFAKVNGVTVNRGPGLDWIERKAGPLSRVRIADLTPAQNAPPAGAQAHGVSPIVEAAHRAADASRDVKRIAENGAPAPREVPLLRLLEKKREAQAPAKSPLPSPTPADTSKH
jgi:hypothetical protein